MDAALITILEDCTRLSYTTTGAFPRIVAMLAQAGVDQYHADLLRAEKTFYMPDGSSHICAAEPVAVPVADRFDAALVQAAIRDSQAGSLHYRDFMARIAMAGCTSYFVSISGRRALYLGRRADSHLELFPGTSP
ncbi:DUF1398 domain-containing protein [Niveispirillum sp. KHB5.9]|uniref:DUF1398 domain-containing protein n=1 Tax=Niveispirillum sp. KHB5.9 TaxID=3400269 RepID=UPI003A84E111